MNNIFNNGPNNLGPFKVTETLDELVIKIPWHINSERKDDGMTLLFGVGSLIGGIVLIYLQEGFFLSALGGFFAVVGALLALQAFVNIFNTTTITVTKDHITTRNRPFPFTGVFGSDNSTIPVANLDQVVTENYGFGDQPVTLVQLVPTNGRARKVFQFKKTAHLAKPLEQRIELFLEIVDDPNAVSPRYAEAQQFLDLMQDDEVLQSMAVFMEGDIGEIAQYVRSGDAEALAKRVKGGDIGNLIARIKDPNMPDPPRNET